MEMEISNSTTLTSIMQIKGASTNNWIGIDPRWSNTNCIHRQRTSESNQTNPKGCEYKRDKELSKCDL